MRRLIASAAGLVLLASTALGVRPAVWRHATEAHFTGGQFKATGTNSRGEIALGRDISVLMSSKDAPAVVSAMVVQGKTIYAAAGPDPAPASKGVVYAIADKTVKKFATVPTVYVTTLAWADGRLLAGGGGQGAGIYAIDANGAVKALWADAEATYVWAIVPGPAGVLYAATGAKGRVYAIDVKTGKGTVIYDAGKLVKNVLCLVRRPDGTLCAGTDEKGLVIEINPKAKTGRVIFNADEKEIAAILTAPDGGYFVATSDASKANADGKVAPSGAKNGKAPGGATTKPKPGGATTKPAAKPAPKPADAKPKPAAAPAAKATAPAADKTPKPKTAKKMVFIGSPSKPAATPPAAPKPKTAAPTRKPTTAAATGVSGPGNAVYYIQADGLARTVFRKPLTILDMIRLNGDELVLATGNGGGIYTVTIDGDLMSQLADTDAKQVTAVGLTADGRIAFATANAGSVGVLAAATAAEGTYVSKAQDAKQFARWGATHARVTRPAGTKVTFATRSGNVAKPDDATWSAWSAEQPLAGDHLQIASPPARFLQYRLTLTSAAGASATVHEITLAYQVGNLAPAIKAVLAKPVAKMGSKVSLTGALVFRQIGVTAADPNGDALLYKLDYRPVGGGKWIKITDKLTKPAYYWNTLTLADGTYELRVTVSDENANAQASALEAVRISEPVIVDNTSPVVARLAGKAAGKTIAISGQVADALSRLRVIQYAVDSDEKWRTIIPEDGITDSRTEAFSVKIKDLKAGPHRIAIRATDALGNTGYAATTITIAE